MHGYYCLCIRYAAKRLASLPTAPTPVPIAQYHSITAISQYHSITIVYYAGRQLGESLLPVTKLPRVGYYTLE